MASLRGDQNKYGASTLYRLYHHGVRELNQARRTARPSVRSAREVLSPQSIDAIRAAMDASMTRLQQSLSSQMVLLTIAISGGPFLGLLGTVIGVMITFAAIALSGDVNVNAIAPGIAAALGRDRRGPRGRDPVAVRLQLAEYPDQIHHSRQARVRRRVRHAHRRAVQLSRRRVGLQSKARQGCYDDINITPMLDLAYVLMVIFIIMTTASVQGIKVNLPKASDTPSLAKPQTKAITITADGTMYLDTYPVSLPELETLLRQYKAANPNLPVIVKADSSIAYQRVVDVLDLVGRLDITQLGLVTQRIVK